MRIGLTFDYRNKAVKQAKTDILALGKSALKATVGITSASMAVQKLNQFLQQSVQAAMADQKAQAALTRTLENSGFGMASRDVAEFIDQMQLATGVSEDSLRPAFTALFNAVGSVTEAQRLLNIALDVSASTGRDVTSVTAALGKAALGSNTAIQRLGLGISKTELATKSFDEVVGMLEAKFTGTAARAADTMGGKFDRLRIAVGEAKEEIGTGLLDALDLLAREGGSDIDSLNQKIITLGQTVGDFARGLGVVGGKLREIGNIPVGSNSLMSFIFESLPGGKAYAFLGELITGLGRAERAAQGIGLGGSYYSRQAQLNQEKIAKADARRQQMAEQAKKRAAAAEQARQRAAEAQKKKAAEREAKLKELGQKFDLELIGLAAAKRKSTDEETLNRLTALQTLALSAYDSEKQSINELDELIKKLTATQNAYTASVIASAAAWGTVPNPNAGSFRLAEQGANQGLGAGSFAPPSAAEFRQAEAAMGGVNIPITIQGSVVAQQDLEEAVLSAVNRATRGGGTLRGLPQAV